MKSEQARKGKKRIWRAEDYVTHRISLQYVKEFKAEFDLFDANKQGVIDPKQLKAVLESLGWCISGVSFFYEWSLDDLSERQQWLDFRAFVDLLCPIVYDHMPHKQTNKIFAFFCKNQSVHERKWGMKISCSQFVKAGLELDPSEDIQNLEYNFNRADLDKDGFITEDDFYNMLTHKIYWEL